MPRPVSSMIEGKWCRIYGRRRILRRKYWVSSIDRATRRPVMTDSQMATCDNLAVMLTADVDVGIWVRSSSGMGSVPFAHSVTLGTKGGSHVEGTACLDLFWGQATYLMVGHRARERRSRGRPGEGDKKALVHLGDS